MFKKYGVIHLSLKLVKHPTWIDQRSKCLITNHTSACTKLGHIFMFLVHVKIQQMIKLKKQIHWANSNILQSNTQCNKLYFHEQKILAVYIN